MTMSLASCNLYFQLESYSISDEENSYKTIFFISENKSRGLLHLKAF